MKNNNDHFIQMITLISNFQNGFKWINLVKLKLSEILFRHYMYVYININTSKSKKTWNSEKISPINIKYAFSNFTVESIVFFFRRLLWNSRILNDLNLILVFKFNTFYIYEFLLRFTKDLNFIVSKSNIIKDSWLDIFFKSHFFWPISIQITNIIVFFLYKFFFSTT